jgi:hypothetical protein
VIIFPVQQARAYAAQVSVPMLCRVALSRHGLGEDSHTLLLTSVTIQSQTAVRFSMLEGYEVNQAQAFNTSISSNHRSLAIGWSKVPLYASFGADGWGTEIETKYGSALIYRFGAT